MPTLYLQEPYIRTPSGIRLLAHQSVGVENGFQFSRKPNQNEWPKQAPSDATINEPCIWDAWKPNKDL